jgi:hypothetical protein
MSRSVDLLGTEECSTPISYFVKSNLELKKCGQTDGIFESVSDGQVPLFFFPNSPEPDLREPREDLSYTLWQTSE